MTTLLQHPLSAAFPAMPDDEFAALRADIKANGVREAITLYEGMVIDGWHRYSASQAEGVHCPSKLLPESSDPVAFVISANLHRRHLTGSQRALAVVECSKWAPAGRPSKKGEPGSPFPAATAEQMAQDADVSIRTVQQAKKVSEKASEEVKAAVKAGKVGVKKASKVASLPKAKQGKALKEVQEPKPKKQPTPAEAERDQAAEDAHGDFDPIADLEHAYAEIKQLHALVDAAQADDQKAETLKWRRAYDNAVRQQSEAMDRVNVEVKLHAFKHRQLMRCGKAVGEDDPNKIAAAVEGFVRRHKEVA